MSEIGRDIKKVDVDIKKMYLGAYVLANRAASGER